MEIRTNFGSMMTAPKYALIFCKMYNYKTDMAICQGFFCDNTLGEDVDGCLIECTEGHFLLVDPRNGGSWQCVEENPNTGSICPGNFNTGKNISG